MCGGRREAGEIRDRDFPRRAIRPDGFHGRIEYAHRHRHVARMRRDAGVAHAHDRMLTAEAADGAAAAAGLSLIARLLVS